MLDIDQIKSFVDKDYVHNQVTRERAADDLVFAWITQWDDGLLGATQLQYRGEFNVLRKAMREIIADLKSNPVQIDFQPIDDDKEDSADFLDGKYRATSRENTSIESFDNAQQEATICGVGAWRLKNKYRSMRNGDKKQVIVREPLYEANNNVFWDNNAKLLDKSDATRCCILWPYTVDGYKSFYSNLTGDDYDDIDIPQNFKSPEQSYAFPWLGGENNYIYVGEFYHREVIKDKILTFVDLFGQEEEFYESLLDDEQFDALEAKASELIDEKDVERSKVTLYIVTGSEIIDSYEVPGGNIPVVPYYGERAFVEGQEHYEGIVKLAKDPQRLRNFQMSYLADIVSRSPRRKPIFDPRQIAGFEHMYEESGADNNYPYYLINTVGVNGVPLGLGPVGEMPEQPIPSALAASIQLSREAINDVAKSGAPSDISDPDLSAKAIVALQNKIELQSMVYQENGKHAKRRDAEIFAAMASVVYDSPRKESIVLPDGTQKTVVVMDEVLDEKGNIITLNDVSGIEFDVYADIGPSYNSRKEETRERLSLMIQAVDPSDPMRRILMLTLMQLTDGVDFRDVRDYARKELILAGVKPPDTDEEKEMMARIASQPKQPDPNILIGQAEMMKGQAAIMKEQRETAKTQSDILVDQAGVQIDQFEAETDRLNTQLDAQKARAELDLKRVDVFGRAVNQRLRGAVNI